MDSDRIYAVAYKLADYVKSPTLRHVRDPHNVQKLAKEIVQAVDQASSVWKKWEGAREEIAKAAAPCWIPTEDLQAFLNRLPGPALTHTDVVQRLRAFYEEPSASTPTTSSRPAAWRSMKRKKRKALNCGQSSARFRSISNARKSGCDASRKRPIVAIRRKTGSAGSKGSWLARIAVGRRSRNPRNFIAVATAGRFGSRVRRTNGGTCTGLRDWKTPASSWGLIRVAVKPVRPWKRLPMSLSRSGDPAIFL